METRGDKGKESDASSEVNRAGIGVAGAGRYI